TRVEAARSALDAQLAWRVAVALEVATSGLLDPATSVLLADAADRARGAGDPPGEAESDLSSALAAAFPATEATGELGERPGAYELLDEVAAAARRVQMARRFYNDTVTTTRALRERRRVRWFRLAGH